MAFHLALLDHPQDALVVWTFSSILYHGLWSKGLQFARENVIYAKFVPEISTSSATISDESLLEEVSHLASLVKSSSIALTTNDALQQSMARYPNQASCSGLVSIDNDSFLGFMPANHFIYPFLNIYLNTGFCLIFRYLFLKRWERMLQNSMIIWRKT